MNETTIPEEEIREAWNSCGFKPYSTAEFEEYSKAVGTMVFYFYHGCVARAAKHAEEVVKLRAELSRQDKEMIRLAIKNSRLQEIDVMREKQLTAAREREEKAIAYIESKDRFNALPASASESVFAIARREIWKARAAYDSSRAADGKGGA